MPLEGFKRTVGEKIDDAHTRLQNIRVRRMEARMGYDGPTEDVTERWGNEPLTVKVGPAGATTLSLYVRGLKNPEAFVRRYGGMSGNTRVGEITIFSFNEDGDFYAEGKTMHQAAIGLLRDVKERLRELAAAIERGDQVLAGVQYFYGLSRLAHIGDKFGFDVFDVAEHLNKDTPSHEWARESYEIMGDRDKADILGKKEARLAIISREELVRKFGTASKST